MEHDAVRWNKRDSHLCTEKQRLRPDFEATYWANCDKSYVIEVVKYLKKQPLQKGKYRRFRRTLLKKTRLSDYNNDHSDSCNNESAHEGSWSPCRTIVRSSVYKTGISRFIVSLILLYCYIFDDAVNGDDFTGHYTRQWAALIPNGHINGLAEKVAADHELLLLGRISEFDDYYHFEHPGIVKRSIMPATEHHGRLVEDERVHWAEQQRVRSRRRRDYLPMSSTRFIRQVNSINLNDPKWPNLWYLNRGRNLDMNVVPAWKQGITGKNVVVTILDDGLERDHPDLIDNYDPRASSDVNDHDDDPSPRYDMTDSNRHGTRCAGEVAAVANNSICSVGIAYNARIGGVRMLDGDVTDAVEARSLAHNPDYIDIYSASWGPDDDGKTVDGPGELATRAFLKGISLGRQGKGNIFIWASGNGGRDKDNCNCDGYTNSIWTLSISSTTEEGLVPWYSEKCSSTLATTYSSGSGTEKQIVTTDLHHSCTLTHTGTSASAPLAAAIAALALEANRNLTWRDMQHIVVRAAKPANLQDVWLTNGVGRRVSHSFGFGLMDAAEMVRLARTWVTVPKQQKCEIYARHLDRVINANTYIALQLSVKTDCAQINYLEHVQAVITLSSQRRGDIKLVLVSPSGTRVTLLTFRPQDHSRSGFNQWPFMSVHTWGESPHGNWTLEIHNASPLLGQILEWGLTLYGTTKPPQPHDKVNNQVKQNIPAKEIPDVEPIGGGSVLVNNSATCLKWNNQICIECFPSNFIYKGSCYVQCPNHTYPLAIGHVNLNDNGNEISVFGTISTNERHRRGSKRKPMVAKHCGKCHYSCFSCSGPAVGECSSCNPDSELVKLANESRCYDRVSEDVKMPSVHIGIIMYILLCVIILAALAFTIRWHRIALKQEAYSPVAFDTADYDDDSEDEQVHFLATAGISGPLKLNEYKDEA